MRKAASRAGSCRPAKSFCKFSINASALTAILIFLSTTTVLKKGDTRRIGNVTVLLIPADSSVPGTDTSKEIGPETTVLPKDFNASCTCCELNAGLMSSRLSSRLRFLAKAVANNAEVTLSALTPLPISGSIASTVAPLNFRPPSTTPCCSFFEILATARSRAAWFTV